MDHLWEKFSPNSGPPLSTTKFVMVTPVVNGGAEIESAVATGGGTGLSVRVFLFRSVFRFEVLNTGQTNHFRFI